MSFLMLGGGLLTMAGGLASGAMASGGASAAAKMQQYIAQLQKEEADQWYKNARLRMQPYQKFGVEQLPLYQQSLQNYSNAIPGYWDQVAQYQAIAPDIQNAIAQYQTVAPQYQQAMQDYRGALGRYENLVGGLGTTAEEMGDLAKRYQQAVNRYYGATGKYESAIPEMTGKFTQAEYEATPNYTPMVRNLAELQATPGYQFELAQGQKALAQSAAARGGMLSGAQQQAAQRFGQQQAATGFQNAWQRSQDAYKTALAQHQAYQGQMSNVLGANVGNYATGAQLTAAERDIISGKANIQNQQLAVWATY